MIEVEVRRMLSFMAVKFMAMVAVIVDMEERLDITFDDGDLDPAKLITVSDLVELAWKSI